MINLSLRDGRYIASALDAAGAAWLQNIASVKCEITATAPGCLVDPRFINEFLDSADMAGIAVSVHAGPLEGSLVA